VDLEPTFPDPATALATPYGIAVTTDTGDNTTLVATAAATSRIFTANDSGTVLSQLDVGAIPRGLALLTDPTGAPQTAYVLNTLDNTVTVVDVSVPADLPGSNPSPVVLSVGADPTPANVQLGRIAFNDAFGSDSGTFACASCHPDANTDQLLWRIGGRNCAGCTPDEDEIRSTMPIRGLENTLPLHWDGVLGDPFGGINGAGGSGTTCSLGPVGDPDRDHACFRDLVDASLSGVMCEQVNGVCQVSPDQSGPDGSNLPGRMTDTERENMAFFLASVVYPPARSRPVDDVVSAQAIQGFSDFFVDRAPANPFIDDLGDFVGVATCADMDSGCHALPLGTATNSATVGGFDAPTMRGMTDRFLHFSIGITAPEEAMNFTNSSQTIEIPGLATIVTPPADVPYDPADGLEESAVFSAAFAIFEPLYHVMSIDIFQMFEEASTGFPGATGRQVTLTPATVELGSTIDIMTDLEEADAAGLVNLRARGKLDGALRTLSYRSGTGTYKDAILTLAPVHLRNRIDAPGDAMTLTAELRAQVGSTPQPLLSITDTGDGPMGNPNLALLPGGNPMSLEGIDVHRDASILVDGQPVIGTLLCLAGSFTPYCDSELVEINLGSIPSPNGLHLLQVQNPQGILSNELPICVGVYANCL
jgi:hypothetical protein